MSKTPPKYLKYYHFQDRRRKAIRKTGRCGADPRHNSMLPGERAAWKQNHPRDPWVPDHPLGPSVAHCFWPCPTPGLSGEELVLPGVEPTVCPTPKLLFSQADLKDLNITMKRQHFQEKAAHTSIFRKRHNIKKEIIHCEVLNIPRDLKSP